MMINKRLMGLGLQSRKYIFLHVLVNWISLLCNISVILLLSFILQQVLQGQIGRAAAAAAVIGIPIAIGIRFACNLLSATLSYRASAEVKKTIREKIYNKLLRLGASYSDKVPTAEVVQVAVEGVEQIEVYFGRYLPQLLYCLLAPLTLFLILSHISFTAAFILLVCVPLIPMAIILVQKYAKKLFSKYWGVYVDLGESFLENLQGLTTLKIYQADERKNIEMNAAAESFRRITMKVLTMQLNSIALMDMIAFGGAALGGITAVIQYMGGRIELWEACSLILLSSEFFIPLRLLGSFFHIAMNGVAAGNRIFDILDMEEALPGVKPIRKTHIKIANLRFAFDEKRQILKGIDMRIPQGGFIAIVGESGSGKSTLASLIMGIHKGYSGQLSVGGVEVRNLEEQSIMEHMTMVRHNSYIFKGTVKQNLKMGNGEATERQMLEALRKVHLLDFVMAEGGLSKKLLEKGANLSGGQRRRLALARALLHDSEVYIFDEVTSSIDVESEENIMDVIHALGERKKTVIFISHRLVNVVKADCIFVLSDGIVAEAGNHDTLLLQGGLYAQLYNGQQMVEGYAKEVLGYT